MVYIIPGTDASGDFEITLQTSLVYHPHTGGMPALANFLEGDVFQSTVQRHILASSGKLREGGGDDRTGTWG